MAQVSPPYVVYIIGPPVCAKEEVCSLVEFVISRVLATWVQDFSVIRSHGPVVFKSEWVTEGERRRREERPGM